MKKLIGLILLLSLIGCISFDSGKSSAIDCDNKTNLGSVTICLPEIDGMNECYSRPNVKTMVDLLEPDASSVLAFYVNGVTYNQIDKINQVSFDDYFKISIAKNLMDKKADISRLDQLSKLLESNFLKKNWNKVKNNVENNFKSLSVGQPVIIETYSPHSNVESFIMLLKYQTKTSEYVMVMSMNMVLVKERLIYLIYYKEYKGLESIKEAKAKNDFVVLRLVNDNS